MSPSWLQGRRDQRHPQTAGLGTVPAQQQPCRLRPQLWQQWRQWLQGRGTGRCWMVGPVGIWRGAVLTALRLQFTQRHQAAVPAPSLIYTGELSPVQQSAVLSDQRHMIQFACSRKWHAELANLDAAPQHESHAIPCWCSDAFCQSLVCYKMRRCLSIPWYATK